MDKQTKRKALKQVDLAQQYMKVFSGPDGEAVLADMFKAHGMMTSTYKGNVKDLIFKEGERNVVLRILHKLNLPVQELRERIESYANEEE